LKTRQRRARIAAGRSKPRELVSGALAGLRLSRDFQGKSILRGITVIADK
jgi:hypothetical protein